MNEKKSNYLGEIVWWVGVFTWLAFTWPDRSHRMLFLTVIVGAGLRQVTRYLSR